MLWLFQPFVFISNSSQKRKIRKVTTILENLLTHQILSRQKLKTQNLNSSASFDTWLWCWRLSSRLKESNSRSTGFSHSRLFISPLFLLFKGVVLNMLKLHLYTLGLIHLIFIWNKYMLEICICWLFPLHVLSFKWNTLLLFSGSGLQQCKKVICTKNFNLMTSSIKALMFPPITIYNAGKKQDICFYYNKGWLCII